MYFPHTVYDSGSWLCIETGCADAFPLFRAVIESESPTPVPANDEEAIRFLLQAEGEGVVNKDIDRLMSLWAEDCFVADAKHTPDDVADDLTWKGVYAVRDRYITLVFTGNPSMVAPADLSI